MRTAMSAVLLGLLSLGCRDYLVDDGSSLLNAPTNLIYDVEPSGTPGSPSGVLLSWDFDNDPAIAVWNVYSRGSTSDSYQLRGSTTSNTYHDNGIPHLQYYVTAEDDAGFESDPSNAVTVGRSPQPDQHLAGWSHRAELERQCLYVGSPGVQDLPRLQHRI